MSISHCIFSSSLNIEPTLFNSCIFTQIVIVSIFYLLNFGKLLSLITVILTLGIFGVKLLKKR